jgi:hypothetical protein
MRSINHGTHKEFILVTNFIETKSIENGSFDSCCHIILLFTITFTLWVRQSKHPDWDMDPFSDSIRFSSWRSDDFSPKTVETCSPLLPIGNV